MKLSMKPQGLAYSKARGANGATIGYVDLKRWLNSQKLTVKEISK
jgi:hypothetical protein